MAEMILEKVLRCRFCGREMNNSALGYEQNPFCTICLPERVKQARPRGHVNWKTDGNYAIAEVSQRPLTSARKRRRA